jgi:hypothetical protein
MNADSINKLIHEYLIPWAQSIPPESWGHFGIFIGIAASVTGIVAWKRWKFLRDTGEKLGSKITLLSVQVWSLVLTGSTSAIDYLTNSSQLFGPFVPKEYLAHATEAAAAAVAIHAIAVKALKTSTEVRAWWVARKQEKLTTTKIPGTLEQAAELIPVSDTPTPVTKDLWNS